MTKHTTGPWRALVIAPNNMDEGTAMVGTSYPNGAISCIDSGWTWEECAHNACLIAAAPDLLEALQALLASSMSDPNKRRSNEGRWKTINARTEAVEAARAAVAKATQSA